jgi:hypothetical protein
MIVKKENPRNSAGSIRRNALYKSSVGVLCDGVENEVEAAAVK